MTHSAEFKEAMARWTEGKAKCIHAAQVGTVPSNNMDGAPIPIEEWAPMRTGYLARADVLVRAVALAGPSGPLYRGVSVEDEQAYARLESARPGDVVERGLSSWTSNESFAKGWIWARSGALFVARGGADHAMDVVQIGARWDQAELITNADFVVERVAKARGTGRRIFYVYGRLKEAE